MILLVQGELLYRLMKTRVRQPVRRQRLLWCKAAAQFVFALSARFKSEQLMFNSIFNWGVITDFKM